MDIPIEGIDIVRRILEMVCHDHSTISISADGYTYTAEFLSYQHYIHEEGRPAVRLTVERSTD